MVKKVVSTFRGPRTGQDHQNAKLTDLEVELIRQLHEDGISYRTLADKFDVSKSLIALICRYERRVRVGVRMRRVHVLR